MSKRHREQGQENLAEQFTYSRYPVTSLMVEIICLFGRNDGFACANDLILSVALAFLTATSMYSKTIESLPVTIPIR